MLPLVVIRRLDCVLEPTKAKVLERLEKLQGKVENIDPVLRKTAGEGFYNSSPLTMTKLLDDPSTIADNLKIYGGFSESARDVIEKFEFDTHIDRLERANLLYLVTSRRGLHSSCGSTTGRERSPTRPSARSTLQCAGLLLRSSCLDLTRVSSRLRLARPCTLLRSVGYHDSSSNCSSQRCACCRILGGCRR
ncbi:MAG: type I restriction-modification system subunit M N-terminal domain-containing protein [Actinomycetota bacterium]